jgi:hypothetical protein
MTTKRRTPVAGWMLGAVALACNASASPFTVATAWAAPAGVAASGTSTVQFSAAGPVTILTTDDLRRFGLFYPDMPIGVVPAPDGRDFVFGPGGSFQHIGPGPERRPTGTYKFVGTLDHIAPAKSDANGPEPSLMLGRRQPSPDGSDFDRDYAGGGPTYIVRDARWQDKPILIQIYHGEYHPDAARGHFFGASGMAVSTDWGDSFTKLGEILAPQVSREEFLASGAPGGPSTDGFLTEADENGNPITGAAVDPASVYDYVIFADRGSMRERPAFVIARVRKTELLDAVARGTAPQFKRYFAPAGASRPLAELFTEPGIGGNATPIIAQNDYLAQPEAVYDSYVHKFILSYMVNQKTIMLRTGDNLFHWSDPVTVVPPPGAANEKIFYPSLVGSDHDPQVLGKTFFVYYLLRTHVADGGRDSPEFLRTTATISP